MCTEVQRRAAIAGPFVRSIEHLTRILDSWAGHTHDLMLYGGDAPWAEEFVARWREACELMVQTVEHCSEAGSKERHADARAAARTLLEFITTEAFNDLRSNLLSDRIADICAED